MKSPERQQSSHGKTMTKQLTGKRDDTPLHTAARAGNLELVVEIISNIEEAELKQLLSKQNNSGETALYVAAEHGDVDLVKEIIYMFQTGNVFLFPWSRPLWFLFFLILMIDDNDN
nr:ankyrin repeat-containing protein [Quercus suber]